MTKNLIKKNLINLGLSATLAINEKSKELIAKGKKVYRFGFGQSPFPVPEKIVSVLKKMLIKKHIFQCKVCRNLGKQYQII